MYKNSKNNINNFKNTYELRISYLTEAYFIEHTAHTVFKMSRNLWQLKSCTQQQHAFI